MRLALRFGRHDVDRFMRELGARQFAEWTRLFALEADPSLRDDKPRKLREQLAHLVKKKRR